MKNDSKLVCAALCILTAALAGCGSDEDERPTSSSGSQSGSGASGGGGQGSGGAGASGGSGGSGGATGGSGATGGAGGMTAWEAYCTDLVAREEMCDPANPPSPSGAECVAAEPCFQAVFRAEAQAPLMECLSTRPCDKSDDACFAEVQAATPETAAQQAYKAACDAKLTECPGDFSDDWCTGGDVPWGLFNEALHDDLTTCFSMACDEVEACLETTVEALAEACDGELGF